MSEARIDRLEVRFDSLDDRLRRVEEIVIRIDERLAATLPTLATKAELAEFKVDDRDRFSDVGNQIGALRTELADKPSRLYMWGVMAAMTAAYTAALAAGAARAMLLTYLPHR